MKWIYVGDKLPEEDGYYIVVEEANHLVFSPQRDVGFSFYDIDEKEWGDVEGTGYNWPAVKREYNKVEFSVIWWMPLPDFPSDYWPEMKAKLTDRSKTL